MSNRKSGWKLASVRGLSNLGCRPKFEFDGVVLTIAGECVEHPSARLGEAAVELTRSLANGCWKHPTFGSMLRDEQPVLEFRFQHHGKEAVLELQFEYVKPPVAEKLQRAAAKRSSHFTNAEPVMLGVEEEVAGDELSELSHRYASEIAAKSASRPFAAFEA